MIQMLESNTRIQQVLPAFQWLTDESKIGSWFVGCKVAFCVIKLYDFHQSVSLQTDQNHSHRSKGWKQWVQNIYDIYPFMRNHSGSWTTGGETWVRLRKSGKKIRSPVYLRFCCGPLKCLFGPAPCLALPPALCVRGWYSGVVPNFSGTCALVTGCPSSCSICANFCCSCSLTKV